jgi:hypothetical protein
LSDSIKICIIAFFYIICIALAGNGCVPDALDFVAPQSLKTPPIAVTVEQISKEYREDPISADIKYLGKELLFEEVVVEEIHRIYNSPGAAMPFTLTVDYFTAGGVSFQILDFAGALQRVQEGYILKLEGTCRGLLNGRIFVNECWYQSIRGDMGPAQGGFGAGY